MCPTTIALVHVVDRYFVAVRVPCKFLNHGQLGHVGQAFGKQVPSQHGLGAEPQGVGHHAGAGVGKSGVDPIYSL